MIRDIIGGALALLGFALLLGPRKPRPDRDGRSPAQIERLRELEGQW